MTARAIGSVSRTRWARPTSGVYDGANKLDGHCRSARAGTTSFVYDGAGNLQATIDPLGNIATRVFDTQNRLIATVDALGNRTIDGL